MQNTANPLAPEDVVWRPQTGPQKSLIDCPVYEIFYGGARGGGKTDGVLGKYLLKSHRYRAGFNGVVFRKELPMLDDVIARSHQIYKPVGAKYNEQKKTWFFPWGGRLRFRPMERLQDAEKYQGQNISDVCVEEAGQYSDPAVIFRLHAVLRSAGGVPTQMILTGNPGGPGHQWLKKRFIDPFPAGMRVMKERLPGNPEEKLAVKGRVFIPAKVTDNKILLQNDPGYITALHMVGSEALIRAWLDGDWNGEFGQFFKEFNPLIHVCKPFAIPDHWERYCGLDWGYKNPWACLWFAIDEVGRIYLYQEKSGKENTPQEVGKTIMKTSGSHPPSFIVADTAMWNETDGDSSAEKMRMDGLYLQKADKNRVQGWMRIHEYFRLAEDGRPMLQIFNTCQDIIQFLPCLIHDERNPEDVQKDSAIDHHPDAMRYFLMSRPLASEAKAVVPVLDARSQRALELIRRLKKPPKNHLD